MCHCAAQKVDRGDTFFIQEKTDDLIRLKVITENIGSIRTYKTTNGNLYKIGRRYNYIYAHEGDIEELLNIKLRNKRILENA